VPADGGMMSMIDQNQKAETTYKSPIIEKDAKLLAKRFYEKLQEAGLCGRDVLSVTTQLISIATDQISREATPAE
jgi:hypothetical protein